MRENKYAVIYNEIVDEIKTGKIKPNTKLPSEHVLAERYETSREMIRKALTLLSQAGLIQKIKGKGSIVLDVAKLDFPISGLVSFKELAGTLGKESVTIVHEFGLMKPDECAKAQLNVTSKDEVWKVIRTREIDKEKIILDKDLFNKQYVPFLSKEICENSIYEYLENELELSISFARKEILVEECIDEDYQYLDLEDFRHIVVVKNYVYLDDTSLFQYTESRHRLDKFRFVDFARRGHRNI